MDIAGYARAIQDIEEAVKSEVAERTDEIAKKLNILVTPHFTSGIDPLRITLHTTEVRGTRREIHFGDVTLIDSTDFLTTQDLKDVYDAIKTGIDPNLCGMCLDCREHCSVVRVFENGEEISIESDCCGAVVHIF